MTLWHKILIGLIFLTIPVNFFFACRTLKTHDVWRSEIARLETKIAQVEKENDELEFGVYNEKEVLADKTGKTVLTVEKKGIRQLTQELDTVMFQRGRAWFDARTTINSETGEVVLEILAPDPHNIVQGTLLFCFDNSPVDEGGAYIGKFKVTAVENNQVSMVPAMNCNSRGEPLPELVSKLKKSGDNWNVYEKSPVDERALFADMTEAQLRELLPESSVEEYIKDGKDDPDHPGAKYVRKLRDYELLFDSYSAKLAKLEDMIQASTFNAAYLENTLADVTLQKTFQEKVNAESQEKKNKITKERKAIMEHLSLLNTRIAKLDGLISKYRKDNQLLASDIKKIQFEAVKKFNSRIQRILTVM